MGSLFAEKELVMLPALLALGLPGIGVLAFMLVLMAIFDYLVFTYTKLWHEDRNYYAKHKMHIMGVFA